MEANNKKSAKILVNKFLQAKCGLVYQFRKSRSPIHKGSSQLLYSLLYGLNLMLTRKIWVRTGDKRE